MRLVPEVSDMLVLSLLTAALLAAPSDPASTPPGGGAAPLSGPAAIARSDIETGDPAAAAPGQLLAAAGALPSISSLPPLPSRSSPARLASGAALPRIGVMLTGGLPDGGVLSLVYRPARWVRVDGGIAYNALSLGAQGGVTVVPFHWGLVPTLRLEGGRFFRSDVNDKVARWGGDVPTYLQPALHGFGYDYASAQLGLELGSQRRFVFFVRGGLAWVRGEFGDGEHLRDENAPGTEMDVKGLRISATGPTASLGFLFYVW